MFYYYLHQYIFSFASQAQKTVRHPVAILISNLLFFLTYNKQQIKLSDKMNNHIQYTYLYLQPISAALEEKSQEAVNTAKGENHLQIDGPKFFSSKNRRPPLKLRDMTKINKGYKVYDNEIHFYNFLYEVELKNDSFQLVANEVLKLRLLSKTSQGQSKLRNFTIQFSELISTLGSQNLQITTQTLYDEDDSELQLKVVQSDSPMSFTSLEHILEQKQTKLFESYGASSHTFGIQSLTLKERSSNIMSNDILSTVGSNDGEEQNLTKLSRTSDLSSRMARSRQRLMKINNEKSAQFPDHLTRQDSPVRSPCCFQPSQNTQFYLQSPKLKRLYRMRRSLVEAGSIHCEEDELDTAESFAKTKREYTGYCQNVLLLLGLILIYCLMSPNRRI